MTFATKAERAADLVADLNDHWDTTLNLGGPTFLALEGKESKKLVIRAENVEILRAHFGEGKVKVRQAVLRDMKDLDSFYQRASLRIGKGVPSIGCILEAVA